MVGYTLTGLSCLHNSRGLAFWPVRCRPSEGQSQPGWLNGRDLPRSHQGSMIEESFGDGLCVVLIKRPFFFY